ncbi:lipoprotein Spr/probable lipoprotein NlpC [Nitrosomonas sp. Nm84]|uniref:C40 family peptidase n=1 Tax=Nitrosomonas sp. Nm84 TaxID=200124 RepID=UPI000D76F1C3|nr:NlpC/P60 family protein [Nitrosomonas sp. Nm84]PXW79682.1 lipoprotein Spr/probable lipoprotein NlpC [Nitrosomonas sp. Nm84]
MKRDISQFIILISISFLVSCGSLQERSSVGSKSSFDESKRTNPNHIKKALYSQFDDWQGVRYQRGGLSRGGIDCSGFVHLTFKSKLGLHLPRTVGMQARSGNEIRKDDLRAGDLVFFKTGAASNHVGIYLEKNKFLHASQKRGVTISRLDNIYWKSSYWKSVRI